MGTTVIRCSWIWRHSTRGPTSLNRTAADATERSRRRPAPQCMRIAAAFRAGTAWLRGADGASTSNGRTLIGDRHTARPSRPPSGGPDARRRLWTYVVDRWRHGEPFSGDLALVFTPHRRLEQLSVGASEWAV